MKKLILTIVVLAFALHILKAQEDQAYIVMPQECKTVETKADTNYFIFTHYQTDLSKTESIILDSILNLFDSELFAYEDRIVLKSDNLIEISSAGNYPGMITIKFEKDEDGWKLRDSIQWMAYENDGGVAMLSDLYISYVDMLEEEERREGRKKKFWSCNDTVKHQMQLCLSEKLEKLIREDKKSISLGDISISYLGRYEAEFLIRVGISEAYYLSGGEIRLLNVATVSPDWKMSKKVDNRKNFIYFTLVKRNGLIFFEEGESYRYHQRFGLTVL